MTDYVQAANIPVPLHIHNLALQRGEKDGLELRAPSLTGSATCLLQFTVHSPQSTVHSPNFTVHSSQLSQLTAHSSQLTAHSSQLTAHSSQLTAHSMPCS